MCGVMKSFWSAIILEQQWFGHHRQKEERNQTHERRLEREIDDSREGRVQHQHEKSQHRSDTPAYQQLTGCTVSRPGRPEQRIRAELYCESQSSRNEHRVVLVHRPEVRPQYNGCDDDEGSRNSGEESERSPFLHRRPRLSSSSCFCAAEILRYML